jgi:hypothetical protein
MSVCFAEEFPDRLMHQPHLLHLAVLNDQGVPLASVVSKDLGGVKVEFKCLCELARWVGNESELQTVRPMNQTEMPGDESMGTFDVHPVWRWDQAPHPRRSSQKGH